VPVKVLVVVAQVTKVVEVVTEAQEERETVVLPEWLMIHTLTL
jgi:hypothetical protein